MRLVEKFHIVDMIDGAISGANVHILYVLRVSHFRGFVAREK